MRVPCPGRPGKWFLLYLKFPLSKSMYATKAAFSPVEMMPYFWKDVLMAVAARVASAHSSGNGAPEQDAVVAAMETRFSAVRPTGSHSESEDGTGAEKAQSAKALARRADLINMMFELDLEVVEAFVVED
jgi:hypothetical protein